MKIIAYFAAHIVPIKHPSFLKVIDVLFKTKLFHVNIRNRNLIATFVATGFFGTKFEGSFPASIPSWFGILLYMDLKSKVT